MDYSTYNDALWKELEVELKEVGKSLLSLPSSADEILILLEKAESILSRAWQGLPRSKAGALRPIMTALIAGGLLRNADLNIQVAVASCFSEITRITAPTFPYPDDKMSEIFELFMVALKQLSTASGINFVKAQQILEALATVRSCMIILDIEAEAMIVEMFQLLLGTIQSNHSPDIFNHMETIMTIIIEESDEVSLELLKPLLDSVRKDNKEISPISWELGEKVFEKCATKLQPYLREAVKPLNLKVDDYAEIIASLCWDASSGENMVPKLDGTSEVAGRKDCTPQAKDGNSSDDKDPKTNSAEVVQSEKNKCALQKKRAIKPNSLLRPEEGYELTWTSGGSGGQGSSKISHDSSKNKEDLLLPLKSANANMPNDPPVRKIGSDSKVVFGKRGRSKKEESIKKIRREIVSEKNKSIADKIVKLPLAPEKEETSNRSIVDYGKEMVNARVMVWWPLDKTFYTGTVEAFDPLTKKHKIKYDDDEEEVLDLREERWELFHERPLQIKSSQKPEADHPSPSKEPVKTLEKIAKKKDGSSKIDKPSHHPKGSTFLGSKKCILDRHVPRIREIIFENLGNVPYQTLSKND
ncbi:hypothetical protein OROHE_005717 [Orobanche hederae]